MEGENKSDSSLPQEAQIPFLKAPSVAVVVADQHRTGISARLEAALEAAKPANRSADLVPLNHVYDVRRRELNALVLSAEKYHQALSQLAKARTDVSRLRCSLLIL